jgi:hypothetical protein
MAFRFEFELGGLTISRLGRHAVNLSFRYHELRVVEPRDPWPSLYLEWGPRGLIHPDNTTLRPERSLGPFPFSASHSASVAFEEAVERLVHELTERAPLGDLERFLRRGWLEHPMVAWEDAEWPADVTHVGDGAFRSAATGLRVVARRAPPGPLEAMLVWLASSPHKRWRDTPHALALSDEHLFERSWSGKARALPRSTLRARLTAGRDAVYVFGRGTMLVLPHRLDCPLAAALDAQLGLAVTTP